jgi:hypothetical protein
MLNLYLFPLQDVSMFNTSSYDDNPVRIVTSIVGAVLIVGLIVFLNVSRFVKNSKAFRSGEVTVKKSNPEEEAFQRHAEAYQLKKDEIKFLWRLIRSGKGSPDDIFTDPKILDATFKAQYQQMWKESTRIKSTLNDLVKLFEIRNCIAYFQNAPTNRGRTIRRHIRKEVKLTCSSCLVEEGNVKKGNKTVKSLALAGTAHTGTVLDISAGGCAFTTSAVIKPGAKLKIDIVIDKDRKVSALGESIRINRNANTAVFHTRFLKMMPKSICIINAYIFGYDTK